MKVQLDNIELKVSKTLFGSKIYIELDGKVIPILNDTISRISDILKSNYEQIKAHYISNLLKKIKQTILILKI
jgi:hypothetical protein